MNSFFVADISAKTITLNSIESKHAIKVLRLTEGDKVELYDGKGHIALAAIRQANYRNCILQIENTISKPKPTFDLHIAIAPTKNIDRFEWFLEKATEIGISEITPLLCEHSERKTLNHERLQKIVVAALKQSQRAYLPILNPLTRFDDFLKKQHSKNTEQYIAHCCENHSHKNNLKNVYKPNLNALILIGPEGDFSAAEIERAKLKGFAEISLGNTRLRTETAGIVACHTIQLANQ